MKSTLEAVWCWIKYDCDFIVENGEWKIWHMRTPGMLMTPYDTPWTAEAPPRRRTGREVPRCRRSTVRTNRRSGRTGSTRPTRPIRTNDLEVPPRYATWPEREWPNRDNSTSEPIAPLAEKKAAS